MPIAEIIAEIDAYLFRLRQARELLLDSRTESHHKEISLRKRKTMNERVEPSSSGRRQADENKSRSNHPVAHLQRVTKRVDTEAHVLGPAPGSAENGASSLEQPAIPQPERAKDERVAMVESVVVARVPARRRTGSIRSSVRQRTPELTAKPDANRPAIALAGPVSSKIVVVSAEQMRREREQSARSDVQRPRTLSSNLSGKRAFDALFPD